MCLGTVKNGRAVLVKSVVIGHAQVRAEWNQGCATRRVHVYSGACRLCRSEGAPGPPDGVAEVSQRQQHAALQPPHPLGAPFPRGGATPPRLRRRRPPRFVPRPRLHRQRRPRPPSSSNGLPDVARGCRRGRFHGGDVFSWQTSAARASVASFATACPKDRPVRRRPRRRPPSRPRCRRRPPTPRPPPRGRGRVGSGHPPPICSVSPFDCYILVSRITRRFCSGRLIVAIPPGARQPQIALGGVSVARGLTGASIRGHIALPVPTAPSISRGGGQTHAGRLIFGAPSPSRQRQIAWRGIAIGLGWAGAGTRGLAALPGP